MFTSLLTFFQVCTQQYCRSRLLPHKRVGATSMHDRSLKVSFSKLTITHGIIFGKIMQIAVLHPHHIIHLSVNFNLFKLLHTVA